MHEHTTLPNPPDRARSAGDAGDAHDDVAALRALALALLVPRSRGPQAEAEPQLLVGRLPADLPVTLPLPEGSRLLGTLLSEHPLVVLESELTPNAVISWYEERLLAASWHKLPEPVHPHLYGGFVPAAEAAPADHAETPHLGARPPRAASFVLGEEGQEGPGLGVEPFAGPGGRTVVHLTLHRDGTRAFPFRRLQGQDPWAAMPTLMPPPGVQHWNDRASGSSERIQLNGGAQTDLDLATVAAGYAAQLEQCGWLQQQAGISGPVAWSRWSFSDPDGEPWRERVRKIEAHIRHQHFADQASPGQKLALWQGAPEIKCVLIRLANLFSQLAGQAIAQLLMQHHLLRIPSQVRGATIATARAAAASLRSFLARWGWIGASATTPRATATAY